MRRSAHSRCRSRTADIVSVDLYGECIVSNGTRLFDDDANPELEGKDGCMGSRGDGVLSCEGADIFASLNLPVGRESLTVGCCDAVFLRLLDAASVGGGASGGVVVISRE